MEEFGPHCFKEQKDGRLLFEMDYTDESSLMGRWLFYYREKLIGGIYGDGFAVKDTDASRRFMPDCRDEVWADTPAVLLPCTILEDSGKLCEMVREMYPELPEPKAKKPRKRRRTTDGN